MVNEIVEDLSDDCICKIRNYLTSIENGYVNGNLWGGKIPMSLPNPWVPPDTSFLADLTQTKTTVLETFSMAYNGETAEPERKSTEKKPTVRELSHFIYWDVYLLI